MPSTPAQLRLSRIPTCKGPSVTDETLPPSPAGIRRLLLATDLSKLVEHHTQLHASHLPDVLRGHCPLRPDASPMFFVLRSHQRFRCLGCGARGTALDFLMLVEGVNEESAAQKLREFHDTGRYVALPEVAASHAAVLREVHERAGQYFTDELKQAPKALEYLRSRGVTEATATYFRMGYAPDSWDASLEALKRYPKETLVASGLAIERDDGGHYARFRGRLMFPIRDTVRSIIAFGGRVLAEGEPKYLNSPTTPSSVKAQSSTDCTSQVRMKRASIGCGSWRVIWMWSLYGSTKYATASRRWGLRPRLSTSAGYSSEPRICCIASMETGQAGWRLGTLWSTRCLRCGQIGAFTS